MPQSLSPIDLEAYFDEESPRAITPIKSLTPPSPSSSPHQKLLYRKYAEGKVTRPEYNQLKEGRRRWHAENLNRAATVKPPSPPTEEEMRLVQKWSRQSAIVKKNKQAKATIRAMKNLERREKKIKDAAPLNRLKQRLQRLGEGTRKYARRKHRRTKHRRPNHRRTKHRRTKHRRTKHRR